MAAKIVRLGDQLFMSGYRDATHDLLTMLRMQGEVAAFAYFAERMHKLQPTSQLGAYGLGAYTAWEAALGSALTREIRGGKDSRVN